MYTHTRNGCELLALSISHVSKHYDNAPFTEMEFQKKTVTVCSQL